MDIPKILDKYLTEKYINLFDKDIKLKNQYKDEVYDLLQRAYASIGGVKGHGFTSPDDMVKNIPFWKLSFVDKKLVAVVMYKTSEGMRKLVAIGIVHGEEGRNRLKEITKIEFSRSYAEISDPFLGWLAKIYPEVIKQYRIPSEKAKDIIKKDINIIDTYFYSRNIGGDQHTKMLIGKIPS